MKLSNLLSKVKNKEESLIYDLEADFKSNTTRFVIKLVSELGSSIVCLALLVIIGIFNGIQVFIPLVLIYFFQLGLIEIIKYVFSRRRPSTYKEGSILGVGMTSGSFPSGHTSNAFTMAFLLSNLFATSMFITSLLFIIAGIVGLTRIFLGKHYLLDVVGGAILGIVFSLVGLSLYVWGYQLLFP